ncbi:unnamed protein product [Closterium sp. NIES-54]
MWGIRDGGRVLASGTITAPLRHSTRITRGIPPLKYAWALVVEPVGLDDEEEDKEWTDLDPDVVADPERQWDIAKMTVKEALGCWKGDKVKEAMDEEMRSLIEQRTWKLVPCPPGVNVMKNRWILNTNFRPDGIVEREKARLVVKGFTQVAGVDYEETYAPVGSYVTARVLLAIAAALDLDLMQLDVKNAFLHGMLDRDLYMEQPSYYEDGTPRKSKVDEALYFKSDAEGEMCWLLVYVDDLLAASRSQSMLGELRDLLHSAFQLREISPVEKYLGLQLIRDRPTRRLWLHQGAYVNKTFEDVGWQTRQEEEYRQKVGSLQFAACTTRPDISFACSKLGSGQTVRSDQHWKELDRCLAYLVGSRDVALEFGGGPESLELVGYADADDAGDKQNRTSTGGYIFVLGGAVVSWASQRIRCATLSSTESEYVAAVEAGKEARRLRFLLAEFQLLRSEEPTTLFVDNSSAISVAGGMGLKGSLKHMERRHMWLQHMVKRRKLQLQYIPTSEQPADYLTKALHFPAFSRCFEAVGQAARDIAQLGVAGEEAMFVEYLTTSAGAKFLDPWFATAIEQLPATTCQEMPGLPLCVAVPPLQLFQARQRQLAVEELQAQRRSARDNATLACFTSLQGPGAGAWVSAVPAHSKRCIEKKAGTTKSSTKNASAYPVRKAGPRPPSTSPMPDVLHK